MRWQIRTNLAYLGSLHGLVAGSDAAPKTAYYVVPVNHPGSLGCVLMRTRGTRLETQMLAKYGVTLPFPIVLPASH